MKNEKISNILFSNNFKKFFHSVKNKRCGFDSCEKCIHFLIVEKNMFFFSLVLSTFKKKNIFEKNESCEKGFDVRKMYFKLFLFFGTLCENLHSIRVKKRAAHEI